MVTRNKSYLFNSLNRPYGGYISTPKNSIKVTPGQRDYNITKLPKYDGTGESSNINFNPNFAKTRQEAEAKFDYEKLHPEIITKRNQERTLEGMRSNLDKGSEIYQTGPKKGQATGKGGLEESLAPWEVIFPATDVVGAVMEGAPLIAKGASTLVKAGIKNAKNLEREVSIRALNSKPALDLRSKILNRVNYQAAKSNSAFNPKNLKEFENSGLIHGDEGTLISNATHDLFNSSPGSGKFRKYIKNRILNKKNFNSNQELAKFYSPNRKFSASVTIPNKDYPIGELKDFNFFDDNPISAGRTAKHLDNLSSKLPGKWKINPGSLSTDSYSMWVKMLENKFSPQYKVTGSEDLILNEFGKHSSLSKLQKNLKFAKTTEEKELIKSNIEKELGQMHSKFLNTPNLTQEGVMEQYPYIKGYNLTLHKQYKNGGWLDNL